MNVKGIQEKCISFALLAGVLTTCLLQFACSTSDDLEEKNKYETAKNLIHTYSGTGDNYSRALAIAEDIFQANPKSPYSHLIIAEYRARQYKDYKKGDPLEIWKLTDTVIDMDYNIADAYVIQSKIALLGDRLALSKAKARKATEIDPHNREAMFAYAQVEQKTRNYVAAESWYRKAIDAHSDNDRKSNIYYWLATMFQEMNPPDVAKAREAMQHMVDLSPSAPWKLVNYAIFLNTSTTDYDAAMKYAEESLKQMDFEMGRLTLGMAMYAKWSDKYMKTNGKDGEGKSANEEIGKIKGKTGVSAEKAYQYASQYMRKSRIPEALTSAGIVVGT